jgi:hypothetical protein
MVPQRYFFHIVGDLTTHDPTGGEFASDARARRSAEARLRTLRRMAPSQHIKIVVTDAGGQVLFEVDGQFAGG